MFTETRLKPLSSLPAGVFQASIDVESMYPSLPTDNKALTIVHQCITKFEKQIDLLGFRPHHIISMLNFVVTHTYTQTNGVYYRQKGGVGTGYHSSGAMAEILVDFTYNAALSKTTEKPISLALYVDDAHSLWNEESHFRSFVARLNTIWPNMNFTFELPDEENRLSFLDINVKISDEKRIEFELFQKPTHSGLYLDFDSHCSAQTKWNIVRSESRRVVKSCSSIDLAWKHLEKIRNDFITSGYPGDKTSLVIVEETARATGAVPPKNLRGNDIVYDHILRVPYVSEETTRKLRKAITMSGLRIRLVTTAGEPVTNLVKATLKRSSIDTDKSCSCPLHAQDIDCQKRHVVYKATCTECGEQYIGATARPIAQRLKEHESSVRLQNERSSLSDHLLQAHPHTNNTANGSRIIKRGVRDYGSFFKLFDFRVQRTCRDTLETFLCEAIEIDKLKPKINTMHTNGFIF